MLPKQLNLKVNTMKRSYVQKQAVFFLMVYSLVLSSCETDKRLSPEPFLENGKWGFVNAEGEKLIPAKYDDVLPFSEGQAAVKQKGSWGIIDESGTERIAAGKYEKIGRYSEKRAAVCRNGKWGFVDHRGKEIVAPDRYDYAGDFSEGMALVSRNQLYGYLDLEGDPVVALKYDLAWPFHQGCARVYQNKRYGFIDKKGVEFVPVKYDYLSEYQNGFALARNNRCWCLIDRQGNETEPLDYDSIQTADDQGWMKVSKNGKSGFIHYRGHVLVPLKYDWVDDFQKDVSRVSRQGKYGLIDRSGKELLSPQYDTLFALNDQLFLLKTSEGEIHFVNPLGEILPSSPERDELKKRYLPEEKSMEGTYTDERDGQTYPWIHAGDRDWMAVNLNYPTTESRIPDTDDGFPDRGYGRYYRWEEARQACPAGWKLPAIDEWRMLINELGQNPVAYHRLIEGGSSRLDLKPGGYGYNENSFINTGEYGYFWTSTPGEPGTADCIWLNPVEESLLEFNSDGIHFRNVRCIRE